MSHVYRAKPSLNTTIAPKPHPAKKVKDAMKKKPPKDEWLKPAHETKGKDEFHEVRNLYKDLTGFKQKYTDNKPDKAMKKYKKNCDRRKRQTFEHEEHARHMWALKSRISDIGNKQDRAKNKHDPLSHPTKLFWRRGWETIDQAECLKHYEKKVNNQIQKRKNEVKDNYQVAITDTNTKVDELKFNNGKKRGMEKVASMVKQLMARP